MDNDLVDFAMSCPVDLKVRNLTSRLHLDQNQISDQKDIYYQQTSDGKSILREVMSDIVPSSITDGPKKGFSSPDASWFRMDSLEFVMNRLFNKQSKLFQLLDSDVAKKLYDDHTKGEVNRRLLIWSLLSCQSILETSKS